jgi:TM2 domain-containing membrane protein YozV
MALTCPKCGAPLKNATSPIEDKVNLFLATHSSHLPAAMIPQIRQALLARPDKIDMAMAVDFKDSMIAFMLCLVLGCFRVHRFYIGDSGIGIAQLLVNLFTCYLASIWILVDLFLIWDATRQKNYENLMAVISY